MLSILLQILQAWIERV